jgi:hypothetical protein
MADRWEARYDRLRQQYDVLVKLVVELRRDGFTKIQAPELPQAPSPLPPRVRQAIEDRAVPGSPIERQLVAQALADLSAGKDEETAAQRILDGLEVAW